MNTTYKFIAPTLANIPEELRKIERWVTWRAEGAPDEKPRKVPYSPKGSYRASSTSPATWGTFEQASSAYQSGNMTGIGIVLNGDELCGVDIDHCVSQGVPDPLALEVLDSMAAAYIEISPSGTGLRALGYAQPKDRAGCKGKIKHLDVELYSTARYLTLTGKTLKCEPLQPFNWFNEIAEKLRNGRKVDPATGEITHTPADERYGELMRRVLTGDVYHDSLRDLAAAMVSTGMHKGAVVSHLRALMQQSEGEHDKRWQSRYNQIPELVNSATAKFAPVEHDLALPAPPPLKAVNIGDVLTNPAPPPQFIWDGYLPRGVVTMLGAHGGTGKSTIALMLAVCAALGRPLFAVDTVACKTLFVSLEDGEIIVRHRLAGMCRHWQIDPVALAGTLHIVDGTEYPELFSADNRGAGETTATHHELRTLVQSEGMGLVVVDNASDAYGGDEINRRQVRAFMRALVELARLTNCAVLLLAHVDKNTSRNRKAEGGEGYSGSTAWHNSARSRLFMTRAEDGTLTLEHQKSNLGRMREPLTLEWPENGLPQLVAASRTGIPTAPFPWSDADNRCAVTVLTLIAEFDGRGQYCSPSNTARNQVFQVLKSDPAFQQLRLNADRCKRIITHCQRVGWIQVVDYRHDRKDRQRWQVTSEGRIFADLGAHSAPSAPT